MEAFSSALFKSVGNKVRQFAFNLTETELKAEEATNNDLCAPHGSLMAELAQMCYDPTKYKEIMQVLARRLTDTGEDWRHVYKALLVMEYLVKHGPMKVVHELQGNVSFLEELQSFKYKDKKGKDEGVNIRQRAKLLATLVSNQERVLEEREIAQKNKAKYTGSSGANLQFSSRSPKMGGNYGGTGGASRGFGVSSGGFRDTFGSSPPVGGGGYGLAESPKSDAAEDDPFEATRKRIEKLKGGGANEGSSHPVMGVGVDTGGAPGLHSPSKEPKRAPKKLSQVKVNPEFAAAFSKMNITPTPPPSTGHPGALGGGLHGNHGSNQPAAENDLLGGLDDPQPPSTSTPPHDLLGAGLDNLEISPIPQASTSHINEGWSAFESVPAGSQPQAVPADPFSGMSAGTNSNQNPPETSDPFLMLSAEVPSQQPGLSITSTPTPLPNTFTMGQSPSMQPEMTAFGGPAGTATVQQGNFMTPHSQFQLGGDALSGQMGNWSSGNPGSTPVTGLQSFGEAPGSIGGGGFGDFSNAVSATNSPNLLSSQAQSGSSQKGSSGPMRPGASRPAANRQKDPFADLAVL